MNRKFINITDAQTASCELDDRLGKVEKNLRTLEVQTTSKINGIFTLKDGTKLTIKDGLVTDIIVGRG